MATLAKRTITVIFSGDITGTETKKAADNSASPGVNELRTLASGFNTITVPIIGTNIPTGVTIIPPASNIVNITLKGVTGDTGVQLHDSDPSSIALDPSVTTIGLTAASQIIGVRFIWS